MNITMHDIAKATGVSQSTVSRILNNNPNVKPEKKKRVLDYVEKVGYRPNLLAKSLKKNNSSLIGLCIPDMINPYFSELLETLEHISKKKNYSIIIHNSNYNPVTEWECMMDFLDRQVDGIIIVPFSSYNVEKLSEIKTPTVVVTQIRKKIDSVAVSHKSGGKLAAKLLIELGHQNIGYIGGELSKDDKFLGLYNEIENNGLEFSMENYLNIPDYSNTTKELSNSIYKYIKKNKSKLPTAFFTGNDILAFETIKILDEFGLKVPEDISVIGFDNTIIAKALKITSIKQPIKDIGKLSFEILMNKIEKKISQSEEIIQLELEPLLFERKSTQKVK